MNTSPVDWAEANQRCLSAELARLRILLTLRAGQTLSSAEKAGAAPPSEKISPLPALEVLCSTFGLSSFERDILLLCAGMELDSRFSPLFANLNDPAHPFPTFSMALSLLKGGHWNALTPTAPLRAWRLVEVENNASITRSRLRIDETVLHYLAGTPHMDERLAGYVTPVAYGGEAVPSHLKLAMSISRAWSQAKDSPLPLIQLSGADLQTIGLVAVEAARLLGLKLYSLPLRALPASLMELDGLRRLWEREYLLGNAALLVDASDISDSPAHVTVLQEWVARLNSPLVVAGSEPLSAISRPVLRMYVARPTPAEQETVWRSTLGEQVGHLNGQLEAIVSQFDLDEATIRRIATNALGSQGNGQGNLGNALWAACLGETRPRLGELAQHIPPLAVWSELVLPAEQLSLLRAIAIHVRQRIKVYETWGFAAKSSRGLGISALFCGPSGTGKTMAAEVLANELKLELYRIDLSAVVSKYIGETEKNLRRLFDAAENGGAILFFDEADALFGKRSEVKDSHDRYANVEVSYLLQRMEAYRGLAILTTNLKDALDQAFLRRIRFVVNFPFPDASQRLEIWQHIFPSSTPVHQLDYERLARLNVAGGNIRNIALQAAFLAAEAGEPVQMSHLLRAARCEYAKLGRPLSEAEIGGR